MPSKMLVNFKNVSVLLHDEPLCENLSFAVHRGELIALVGANGCGKSTILNLIANQQSKPKNEIFTDAIQVKGEVFITPNLTLLNVPQSGLPSAAILKRPQRLLDDAPGRTGRMVREFDLQLDGGRVLSDGEHQKLALIDAFSREGDLYLFDEPTNYLDIAGLLAFESYLRGLKRRGKGIILVSHDRTLIDQLADRTILITRHGIYTTPGGATDVWSIRKKDLADRSKQAKDIRKTIFRLQQDMQAKMGWAAQKEKQKIGAGGAKAHLGRMSKKIAKRAKAVEHRVEEQTKKLTAAKPFIAKPLNLAFPDYEVRNRRVFFLQDVHFKYGRNTKKSEQQDDFDLLQGITLGASTTDRCCLMGANGSGKSTLLKIAQGIIRVNTGTQQMNNDVKCFYLPQGLQGFFRRERLLENFDDCDLTTVRKHLGAALLRREKVNNPVSDFSYGELMRAALVQCILRRAEFLFLDEPTSHLDLESIEVLEELLAGFPGGFLLISHDRTFVERVADRLYFLDRGELRLV